jgi:hypothetical protein
MSIERGIATNDKENVLTVAPLSHGRPAWAAPIRTGSGDR